MCLMSRPRSRKFRTAVVVSLLVVAALGSNAAPGDEPLPGLAEATEGLTRMPGLLDVWLDEKGGKVWLELPSPLGSNCTAVSITSHIF